MRLKSFLGLCGVLILSGCAAQPALMNVDEFHDPNEGWNRSIFSFNLAVDDYVLSPVATGYDAVTPGAVRLLVRNELDYFSTPMTFVNSLLQGNMDRTGHVLGRFFINTIFGGFGLLDPATDMGLPAVYEDFGQTLAVYGVGEGFFWTAPFIGPTSPRDIAGKVVDMAFNPLTYASFFGGAGYTNAAQTAAEAVEFRATNADTIDNLRASSQDYYSTVRSIYRQKRNAEILNRSRDDDGKQELEALDFDAE